MTGALGLGIAKADVLGDNSCITLSNPSKRFGDFESKFNAINESRQSKKKLTLKTAGDNIKSIENADIVILSVKPDVIPIVLKQLASHWTGKQVFCLFVCRHVFEYPCTKNFQFFNLFFVQY